MVVGGTRVGDIDEDDSLTTALPKRQIQVPCVRRPFAIRIRPPCAASVRPHRQGARFHSTTH